jgi:hypothetical protein
LEELWPFSAGGGSGSGDGGSGGSAGNSGAPRWRPAVSYADGVQLLVPYDPLHWAVVRRQPSTLIDSLTAAANAALTSATEDLGLSDFGGAARLTGRDPGLTGVLGADEGEEGWEVRRARSEHLAKAVAGAAAGLRAARRALRGEGALQDAGIDDAPCLMYENGAGSSSGSGGRSAGRLPLIGPDPAAVPESNPTAEPLIDVVFVHGVRGGPFVTWRRGDVLARGGARSHLSHRDCWPTAWLGPDLPGARLLSIEYHVSWLNY